MAEAATKTSRGNPTESTGAPAAECFKADEAVSFQEKKGRERARAPWHGGRTEAPGGHVEKPDAQLRPHKVGVL